MKIDFEPDRALYPFESRWFDSSAGRMHYIDEGTGTRSCSATATRPGASCIGGS